MKRKKITFIVLVVVLVSASISLILNYPKSKFVGSRSGNDSQLIMSYSILNTTDFQMLELEAGDTVEFNVFSASGEIDIVLQKEGEEPIYIGSDVPSSSFEVKISNSGTYKASVTGRNSSGSVWIKKVNNH